MIFSIALLIVIFFIAIKVSPVEKKDQALVHGAGQIGLLAAIALFGVDYFTFMPPAR
jgi:threonine dehydrogenase-like Zn-dependent dehydrogenase